MYILYYGRDEGNSGSRLRGLRALGHRVERVFEREPLDLANRLLRAWEWRTGFGPVTWRTNRLFLRRILEERPDLLWVEMGKLIYGSTLKTIRERLGCLLVNTYSDDFLDPMKRSRHYCRAVPHYDYIFTPREINYPELRRFGARAVGKFWKGYNPGLHFPVDLSAEDRTTYAADVCFVGHGEPARIEPLGAIAATGCALKVWGDGWQRYDLPEALRRSVMYRWTGWDGYRKALCGAKIGVQLLSVWARDTQSSRSFEIPACGVMMIADRTDDHRACFEEDREAVFFSSTEELVDKVRYYLAHDAERGRIAAAGHRRCMSSGYSNEERVSQMLDEVLRTCRPEARAPRV